MNCRSSEAKNTAFEFLCFGANSGLLAQPLPPKTARGRASMIRRFTARATKGRSMTAARRIFQRPFWGRNRFEVVLFTPFLIPRVPQFSRTAPFASTSPMLPAAGCDPPKSRTDKQAAKGSAKSWRLEDRRQMNSGQAAQGALLRHRAHTHPGDERPRLRSPINNLLINDARRPATASRWGAWLPRWRVGERKTVYLCALVLGWSALVLLVYVRKVWAEFIGQNSRTSSSVRRFLCTLVIRENRRRPSRGGTL